MQHVLYNVTFALQYNTRFFLCQPNFPVAIFKLFNNKTTKKLVAIKRALLFDRYPLGSSIYRRAFSTH